MDYITSDQLKRVTKRSSFEANKLIITDWVIITGTFLMAAYWPNPLTWVIAVFILGARQLGLGVIVHETGHGTFSFEVAERIFWEMVVRVLGVSISPVTCVFIESTMS